MATIIDGLRISEDFKKDLLSHTRDLLQETGVRPGLAVVRIGEDPPTRLYVERKKLEAQKLGYHFEEHVFPETVSVPNLEAKIKELNASSTIHGIVLQLPLPKHLDKFYFLSLLDPAKDVDGLHPLNAGKLFQGLADGYIACTPLGCLALIQTIHPKLEGRTVGIIGCSILVGRPMAMLLLQKDCTILMAHSKTHNVPEICKKADILVVAIGSPRFIQGHWIKKGATVIDVGINPLPSGKVVGDVDFEEAQKRAGAITPVPGGVGPMTVAALLRNTLEAAFRYEKRPFPL